MATPAAVRPALRLQRRGARPNPFAQLGQGLWRLLTSVDFAVVQIIFLASSPSIGMTLQQLPDFAFRSPGDYATAMDDDPRPLRPGPRAGHRQRARAARSASRSSSRPIFGLGLVVLVISIVVCTLDRTPRLWRDVVRQCASSSRSRSSIRGCPTARR